MAERLAAFCLFVSAYYRALNLEKTMLEVTIEASGLFGTVIHTADRVYPALLPQITCRIVRSAADIGGDISGYAARMLRAFGEGFGLPDAVLTEEGRHLVPLLGESAR